MARSKSNPVNKTERNQSAANPAALPETSAIAAEAAPQLATETAPKARSSERRKAEPRATVVPINLEDEIRQRAYELYEKRGYLSGHETEDWLTAEREVRQRYHQRSA